VGKISRPYLKNKARVGPQMQVSSYQIIKMAMFHKGVAPFSHADICHSCLLNRNSLGCSGHRDSKVAPSIDVTWAPGQSEHSGVGCSWGQGYKGRELPKLFLS